MPQLDKLIFFFENLGFIVSFFGLVFYNQYVFYPKLLKGLFVRRFFILNDNISILLKLFLKYNINLNFIMNFNKIIELQSYFLKFIKSKFSKLFFFFSLKINLFLSFLNLFYNKFTWTFGFFYEIYRSYIVEIYPKEDYDYLDYLKY